jgi:hypothetical protein
MVLELNLIAVNLVEEEVLVNLLLSNDAVLGVPLCSTKNERDPPLFTGKLLIKFQTNNFSETLLMLSYDIG